MKKQTITIGIVGLGRFGVLIASILSKDFSVKLYHYKSKTENKKIAKIIKAQLVDFNDVSSCDVIILAVPISVTEEMIKKIGPKMKKGAILLDTCSVKVYPCKWLKDNTPEHVQIIGTHPMFGPVTTCFDLDQQTWDLKNKQIVLCPLRMKNNHLVAIEKYLKKLGIEVIITTPEDHDRQNAKTLSFVHFIGRSFLKAGIKKQKIFTPGYADLLKILPHTTGDNWQLFFDMNNFNPYSEEVRGKFFQACQFIEEKIIKSNSKNNFDYHRNMIDNIDKIILELLGRRFEHAQEIGKIKKEKGLPIVDSKREKEIIESKKKYSKLNDDFVEKFYRVIFDESYKKQK